MNEATVSKQWSYKFPLEVELVQERAVEVEAPELEVQLNSECFVLLISQTLSFLLPSLFLIAGFIQLPDPGLKKITSSP